MLPCTLDERLSHSNASCAIPEVNTAQATLKDLTAGLAARQQELAETEQKFAECTARHEQLTAEIKKLEEQKFSTLTEIENRLDLLRMQTSVFRQNAGGRMFPDLALESEVGHTDVAAACPL
jgi:peptidoglycan hydrolase CwlO-like protein